MYGLLKGCQYFLKKEEKKDFLAYMCGLCASLSASCGQISRFLTNYDTSFIALLTNSQKSSPSLAKINTPCLFKILRPQPVIEKDNEGIIFATGLSVLMLKAKITDDLQDRDTKLQSFLPLFKLLTKRWLSSVNQLNQLGFPLAKVEKAIADQSAVEKEKTSSFSFYSQQTEQVVSEVFQHTAVLARTCQNKEPLAVMGKEFGRLMYLFDNYLDCQKDKAKGKFNALSQCFPENIIQQETLSLFKESATVLKNSFKQIKLTASHHLVEQIVTNMQNKLHYAFATYPPGEVPKQVVNSLCLASFRGGGITPSDAGKNQGGSEQGIERDSEGYIKPQGTVTRRTIRRSQGGGGSQNTICCIDCDGCSTDCCCACETCSCLNDTGNCCDATSCCDASCTCCDCCK